MRWTTPRLPRSAARPLGGALVAVVLGLLLAVVPERPAFACTCQSGLSLETQLTTTPAVVIGHVVDRADADETEPGGATRYTIDVDQPVKGLVTERVDVLVSDDPASCGTTLGSGEIVVFLTTVTDGDPQHWRTNSCLPSPTADEILAIVPDGLRGQFVEPIATPKENRGAGPAIPIVIGIVLLAPIVALLISRRTTRKVAPDR